MRYEAYWPKGFFMPTFYDFDLQPATYAALAEMQIHEPTPVQAEAIPSLMAGKDLVGQSATGSGKTLAYGIPLVERVARDRRIAQALVLVPTRELAIQVNSVLCKLAARRRLTTALLVGGRGYGSQISALRYGAQIVIGTPGRVKDHLDRGTLTLDQLRMCVLDEADQMLDSGFAPAVEEILETSPATRQTALFSATIPDWVGKLQQKFLHDPESVAIQSVQGAPDSIEQIAYQVPQDKKIAALCTLLNAAEGESSLVFGKTKFGVEKLGKQLGRLGFTVGTLHGNKSQHAREAVLTAFRLGEVQTLLATNVAARGLDIQGIDQVINYELPESSELFTHRVGRTGRMGRQGKAITLLAPSEVSKWKRMTRTFGQPVALQRLAIDEEASSTPPETTAQPAAEKAREMPRQPRQERTERPARSAHIRAIAMPEQEENNRPVSSRKRQSKVQIPAGKRERMSARQPEGFAKSARPASGKVRNGRRGDARFRSNSAPVAMWERGRARQAAAPKRNRWR
jgi:ATP-dependent RNA helicase DeaD